MWFVLVLVVAAALAHADPVDPRIIIEGAEESVGVPGTFEFESNSMGGGFLHFFNGTNEDWISLKITTNIPSLANPLFTADSTLFRHAIPPPDPQPGDTSLTFMFFGVDEAFPGIPARSSFIVGLNNPIDGMDITGPGAEYGKGGWDPGQTFVAVATPIPEPGTWLLMVSGFLVWGLARVSRQISSRRGVLFRRRYQR
jgi:hypothetical protein